MEEIFFNTDKVLESTTLNKVSINKIRIILKSKSKKNIVNISNVLKNDGFKINVKHSFFTFKLIAEFEFKNSITFCDYQNVLGKLSMLSSKFYVELISFGAFD